jgi:Fe-S-cluster containining protein
MGIAENLIWMRDFNRRFDREVDKLYKTEAFWQRCRKCADGHCCGHIIYPVLNRSGNPFMAEDWWLMLEYAKKHFTPADRKQLYRNILSERSHCIFLFGNRCSVHPGRPWTCRFYPFSISFYEGEGQYPIGEIALPSCPAYASSFNININVQYIQKPAIIARNDSNPFLIQVKLKKHRPLWVLDATNFVEEYEKRAAAKEDVPPPWHKVLALAEEVGGSECTVLASYIENVR